MSKKADNDLKKIIKLGEGYHIEFKESLEKSFIEEVCAFANSGGGKIFIGITDKGIIKGVKPDNKIKSQLQDMLKHLEPQLAVEITALDNIIQITVPEGQEKPYGCSKGFFIRIGPNSQKLTWNEIVAFFQKESRIRFDELINTKAIFKKDFDLESFEDFKKTALISGTIDSKSLLENLDCINDKGQFTNAGVLFFCRSIEFLLMQAVVTCILYKGREKLDILDKKDFSGNIIRNIENAVLFIKRHTNIEYKIEHTRRNEIPEIPEPAIREAVVNAVCHRDYFEKGANVIIEIFEDRIEITNPGGLPPGLKPSNFGKKSVARNPVIASLLHRAHYIEKIGTGINRIRNAVKELGKGTVRFSFDTFFNVTFSRISASVKTSVKTSVKIMELMKGNPMISIPEMAAAINKSTRAIEMQISKLKNKGLIERIGPDKGGQWAVADEEQNKG